MQLITNTPKQNVNTEICKKKKETKKPAQRRQKERYGTAAEEKHF